MYISDTTSVRLRILDRWLKFCENPKECPVCGEWDVLIHLVNRYEKDRKAGLMKKYQCNVCKSKWFNPDLTSDRFFHYPIK